MILTSLKTNQLSMVGYNWFISLLAAIENKNFPRLSANMAEDCLFAFNDQPANQDKCSLIENFQKFRGQFESIDHQLLSLLGTDYSFSSESVITYRLADGTTLCIQSVAFVDRNELGLINSLRLYGDFSPLSVLCAFEGLAD